MSQYTFKFNVYGVDEQTLILLYFTGQEAISTLYNFELELRCFDLTLDEDMIINQDCQLQIYYGNSLIREIHGLLIEFEDVKYLPDHTLYRARMVPRAWKLGLFDTNEVYLDEDINQTLSIILQEAGLAVQDFRFDFSRNYRKWPFRLQYNETHLAFLQRIIEREGIYYYFEQSDKGEIMVFCDSRQFLPVVSKSKVRYQANSGVNVDSKGNTISGIICKRQCLPKRITLRDFNEESPSLDIRGESQIDPKGTGEINYYGLNIVSPEEGEQLSVIHAQAYQCRQKEYIGEGDVATMSAGHIFKLENHPRNKFNDQDYLLESISHEGANLDEYRDNHPDMEIPPSYISNFISLSTEHEFSPKHISSKPEIYGTLNAVIDAEGDGEYPELDEFGRYRVILPFDRKDRDGGKASYWIRMMQPFGGANEGMHFPLRKGTRVLLSFIGGDPDRPVIAGTISDCSEQSSIVSGQNQTNKILQTATGNKIELEDQEGKHRIKLESPTNNTYLHLGAPNHDGSGYVMATSGIERIDVSGGQRLTVQVGTVGSDHTTSSNQDVGDKDELFDFHEIKSNGVFSKEMSTADEISGKFLIERRKGNKYLWTDGNEHNYGGGKVFNFGNSYEENHAKDSKNGIVSGNTFSIPKVTGDRPPNSISKLNNFDEAQVSKTWSDTYEYQKGANFSWGDTEDYSFGNGYEEAIMDGTYKINKQWTHDKCKGPGEDIIGTHMTIEADSASVSKTIGDSYEYTKGKSLSITVGDSEEYTYSDGGGLAANSYTLADAGLATNDVTAAGAGIATNETTTTGAGMVNNAFTAVGGAIAGSEVTVVVGGIASNEITAAGGGIATNEITAAGLGLATSEITAAGLGLATNEITVSGIAMATNEIKTAGVAISTNEITTTPGVFNSNELSTCGSKITTETDLTATVTKTTISPSGIDIETSVPGTKVDLKQKALELQNTTATEIQNKIIQITKAATEIEKKELRLEADSLALKQAALNLIC